MAKKTRIEDIDSEAVINSFRLDDTSIPPEARSAGGNAPSPPPKEATQEAAVSLPVPHYKEEPERRRRNGKLEKPDYDTVQCNGKARQASIYPQGIPRPHTENASCNWRQRGDYRGFS